MTFSGKIFGGAVAVILLTALGVYMAALPNFERSLERAAEKRVERESVWAAGLCEQAFESGSQTFDTASLAPVIEALDGSRFTLVLPDGRVAFDSHRAPETMDDHSSRAEILEPGRAVTRFSRTLQKDMTYYALPVEVDGVLRAFSRVSVPVEDRESRLAELRGAIRTGALLAAVFSLLLAGYFSRRVTKPLGEIADLVAEIGGRQTTRRLKMTGKDEIGLLARAVNGMADDLQQQVARVERDRSEREAIFAAMAGGLLAVDAEQRILFINRQARELLGNPSGDLKQKPLWELTRNGSVNDVIERCLASRQSSRGEACLDPGAGEVTVEMSAAPLFTALSSKSEEFRGCVLELRDVSDLRRLEEVRRDFVANVSHELKTPLTAMRGYTEALIEDADMPAATRRSFLERAHRSTERLAAIVGDLLSLTRLESEEQELSTAVIDASALARSVCRDLGDLATSRQIAVTVEGAEQPVELRADGQALGMAMGNLLSNAILYSPQGSQVVINLLPRAGQLAIEVRDQGPGIPEQERERVFERFYRLDKARSRELGGTGLGLSIVRHVMAAHGGRVELESQMGQGSCFRLVLPLA